MNILLNGLSAASGGATSYLNNILPLLAALFKKSKRSDRLYLLLHKDQCATVPNDTWSNVSFILGPQIPGYLRILWERLFLKAIIKRYRIDVVFTPYQVSMNLNGAKQVLMLRNMEPFFYSRYHYDKYTKIRNKVLRGATEVSLKRSDKVIAVSNFSAEYAVSKLGLKPEKVVTINHGRDESFSPNGDEEDDRCVLRSLNIKGEFLLTCGSLLPYRRCEDVIAGYTNAKQKLSSQFSLVIAGDGSDRRYRDLLNTAKNQSGCADNILLIGHVSRELMKVLYRRCGMCIIASEIEACPNIAIEAMSSGCCIISSRADPLPEIFGGCSVEYEPRKVESLADVIVKCVNDSAFAIEMSGKALERAKKFSWDSCARATYRALTDW